MNKPNFKLESTSVRVHLLLTKVETCLREIKDNSFVVKSRNDHNLFGIYVSNPRNLRSHQDLYFGVKFTSHVAPEYVEPLIVEKVKGQCLLLCQKLCF